MKLQTLVAYNFIITLQKINVNLNKKIKNYRLCLAAMMQNKQTCLNLIVVS